MKQYKNTNIDYIDKRGIRNRLFDSIDEISLHLNARKLYYLFSIRMKFSYLHLIVEDNKVNYTPNGTNHQTY